MTKKVKFPSLSKKRKEMMSQKGQHIDIHDHVGKEEDGKKIVKETQDREIGVQAGPKMESDITSSVDVEILNQLRQERDEYLSHLQRLQAEFDNYRKRVQKEKSELKDYLIQDFVRRLLDVIDNMDRALHPSNVSNDVDSYRQGVEMVFQQLINILKDQGLTRMDTVGQVFDPRFHEAIGQMESNDHEPGVIANELMPGYLIGERLLRAPKVLVAIKSKEAVVETPDSAGRVQPETPDQTNVNETI